MSKKIDFEWDETFDCQKTLKNIYIYLIQNAKKIEKNEKLYSDIFYQTTRLSKKIPSYKKNVPLNQNEEREILVSLNALIEIFEDLKADKADSHCCSWDLLSQLLKSEICHIQDTHTIDLEDTYYTLLNSWVCLENWNRKNLKILFSIGLTLVQFQKIWPDDDDTQLTLRKCTYDILQSKMLIGL